MSLLPIFRRLRLIAGVLILALLPLSVPADSDEAFKLRREGRILPLEKILEGVPAVQRGHVVEVELEYDERYKRVVYEIYVIDGDARVWELFFDAETGEFLKRKRER
ncbi:MAG: PepSY domain-containing protein [Chromatiales bacterium]|jgi:uncharacterized membrane protein YkoI|nr:PepSY domain-containing protein [Chromatiales bacterium]MDX9768227.1 PepSY domain-containing protein [Ectothiorhodospiraceae bacterium]